MLTEDVSRERRSWALGRALLVLTLKIRNWVATWEEERKKRERARWEEEFIPVRAKANSPGRITITRPQDQINNSQQ